MGMRAQRKKERTELERRIESILTKTLLDWLDLVAKGKIRGDWPNLGKMRYEALCANMPLIFPKRLRDAAIKGMLNKLMAKTDQPVLDRIEALKNRARKDE